MKDRKSPIPIFKSIEEYNFRINISPPRYTDFDVRDFEKNMKTVRLKMYPFRIPFFQIALLESGGGTVSSEGKNYDLDHCTLFFNLPGQVIYWDVPQNWRGYYLCLDESFYTVQVEGYRRLFDLPYFKTYTPAIKLKSEEAKMILDIMGRMENEYTHPTPYNKPIIKSFLNNILTFCVQFYDRQATDDLEKSRHSSLSERFRELVHHQVAALSMNVSQESFSVGGLAERLFVTPKHLSETIKKDMGVTPTDYINSQLIKESQKLLHSTDLQIKEIAYQLGFSDASYFNRLFKKITEVSPTVYRENG